MVEFHHLVKYIITFWWWPYCGSGSGSGCSSLQVVHNPIVKLNSPLTPTIAIRLFCSPCQLLLTKLGSTITS